MPLLLQKAKIYQIDPPPTLLQSPITVLFNPSEYVIERTVNYAEHVIQGLDLPIAQFCQRQCRTAHHEPVFRYI